MTHKLGHGSQSEGPTECKDPRIKVPPYLWNLRLCSSFQAFSYHSSTPVHLPGALCKVTEFICSGARMQGQGTDGGDCARYLSTIKNGPIRERLKGKLPADLIQTYVASTMRIEEEVPSVVRPAIKRELLKWQVFCAAPRPAFAGSPPPP